MDIRKNYARWLEKALEDPDLIAELEAIRGNEEEIYDRFYRELSFGTAGLRGVIGAGGNRMNIYTVRKATQGLADYLNRRFDLPSVAIAYDSRIKSELFARQAAGTLAANGIRVVMADRLQPTPLLSFAVRKWGCQAGIMVTASHNPAKYNGYKCYGSDGCQMTDESADEVTACIRRLDIFDDVRCIGFEEAAASGAIQLLGDELLESFLDEVLKTQVRPGICADADLRVVFTPLNGTGNIPVREALRRIGISRLHVVPEQELPDGLFPTAPYPNPEIRQAFACALTLAQQTNPDILLATDPDADRVGIAVRSGNGTYELVSGNDTGCLMLYYILSSRSEAGTLPQNPRIVKTIVTSKLTDRIASDYGCEVVNVLTGFKYIGEQILLLEQEGTPERFVFGYEESYGYLGGSYVRDKDAVFGSVIICEMASYYKKQGKTLLDVLADMHERYGFYQNSVLNAEFDGAQGMAAMETIMCRLRENPPADISGYPVLQCSDYLKSVRVDIATGICAPIMLPKSNVLVYELTGGNGVIVRPSGTEPKIKAYITAVADTADKASAVTEALKQAAGEMLKV